MYPFAQAFGANKWGLAIPHFIMTLIGFFFLLLLCKRYFKTALGYAVAFSLFSLNATLVFYSTNIRIYAVLPTLALASLYLSETAVAEIMKMSLKKKWLFGAFFSGVILFHAFGIFMVFISFAYALLLRARESSFKGIFKATLKLLFVVLCVTMPVWLLSVFGPRLEYNIGSSTFQYIPSPLSNPVGFLKGVFGNLAGFKPLYFLLAGLFFPFIFPYRQRYKQILFLALCVFLPLGMILASDIAHDYWFLQRQFIWVMPYFAFFIGWAWDSFYELADAYFKNRQLLKADKR